MKAFELDQHLKSLFTVSGDTVDGILAGSPERKIEKIGTCWLPYWETLKKMSNDGINVVVCHEPLFYAHRGWNAPQNDVKTYCAEHNLNKALSEYEQQVHIKNDWIIEHKMTIIRCHDVLDNVDGFGITYAFAHLIGLKDQNLINKRDYIHVYGIKETTAVEVVKSLAEKLMPLQQGSIAFYGDLNRHVKNVGIGAGCGSDPLDMMELGADFCITITDVMRTWIHGAFANDTGLPLAVVNHGVSEEAGVKELSNYLAHELGVPVTHYPQGSGYITFWS